VTAAFEPKTTAQDTLSQCTGGEANAERLRPIAAPQASPCNVAEVASDWIWETDANSCLAFVSKRFGDISGIPWAQVNGRSFLDLVAMGFERAGMDKIRAATAAHGILQSAVYRVEPARGVTHFWRLSGEPRFDPATGAFAGYRGTGTDVTATIEHEAAMTAALLRAEAAERDALRARRMLEEAIEAIPEGFVLHDADDRLVLCNTRYREIYGLTAELIKPGVLFEDTLRQTGKRSTYVTGDAGLEEWVAERMCRHRALDGNHVEQRLTDGRWLQIEERRTSDGGTVGIRVDVTEARRREALERDRERRIAELQAARLMQMSLLPSVRLQKEIIARSGLDIASRSASCTEIGGDLWGLSALDGGRVGVYTLDVAGHGTTAALTAFRVHTLIHELGAWLLDPGRFLQELNIRLAELLQPGAFATMFYGVVDPEANCIVYAAAGSPPPLIRRGSGLPLTPLDSSGVPLGIIVSAEYPCAKAEFGLGGTLFLYSDILTDRIDEHGTRAGEEGAFAWIQHCAGQVTAETAVERICAPFFDPPGTPLSDDLTVVCIMRP
jgi:serine phosphatase RsbU (regulator of sigma subunit)